MTVTEVGTEDEARSEGRDHVLVRINGRFAGFRGLGKTNICLQRCPECQRENYGGSVSSGVCAWCQFDANKQDDRR